MSEFESDPEQVESDDESEVCDEDLVIDFGDMGQYNQGGMWAGPMVNVLTYEVTFRGEIVGRLAPDGRVYRRA
jgi:hypothetical protein